MNVLAGLKARTPAYTEAERDARRDAWAASWAQRNGLPPEPLKRAKGAVCLARLVRPRCPALEAHGLDVQCDGLPAFPPGADHPSLWAWRRWPVVYVVQSYGLTAEQVADHQALLDLGFAFSFGFGMWSAWHDPAVLFAEYVYPDRLTVLAEGARS